MVLDDDGREGVFEFIRARGYTGTLSQWWDEVEKQSYGAQIRMFDSIWLGMLHEYPKAQAFVRRLLKVAAPRFDSARADAFAGRLRVSFDRSAARRCEHTARPLRLDGLYVDIEIRNGSVDVRCRVYVNNDFRRDRHFVFPTERGAA